MLNKYLKVFIEMDFQEELLDERTLVKGKKSRSGEEGAEQRGRIYKKLGMGERDPKTGTQMAKLGECKTFNQFMIECSKYFYSNR